MKDLLKRLEESWVVLRAHVPGVQEPLFHGTKLGKVPRIMAKGLRPAARYSQDQGPGVSLSRSIEVAFQFGSVVFVVDRGDLNPRKLHATHYGAGQMAMPDEAEERYDGVIPVRLLRGCVFGTQVSREDIEALGLGSFHFPVVQQMGSRYLPADAPKLA